ncbi:MAG: hypothetical protein ACJAS1_006215 [Oleiphilaceae bacterium]|jgi:hypothetical protein
MATFKYYNFQVLPLDGQDENLIGKGGYKSIFEKYALSVNNAMRQRKLLKISHDLKTGMHISFKKIDIKDGFAQGKLIKFDHVDSLVEVYTDQELYKNSDKMSIASSLRIEFDFVFDFDKHIIAIEAKAGIPSYKVLIEALTSLLSQTTTELYSEHYIKLIELTDAASLEEILDNAEGFRKVSVEITFSNSDKFETQLASLIDEDSRKNSIHSIKAEQRPEQGRNSKSLSIVMLPLVLLSTKLGNSNITYMQNGKENTYHMRDYPVKMRVTKDGKMTDDDYYSQIMTSIINADFKAKVAHKTNEKLFASDYKLTGNETEHNEN